MMKYLAWMLSWISFEICFLKTLSKHASSRYMTDFLLYDQASTDILNLIVEVKENLDFICKLRLFKING